MPLAELEEGREARLLGVLDPRSPLVARLYGVGLLPGCKLRVVAKSRDIVLLAVGPSARVVSIDYDVARHVLIVVEEKI